MRGRGSAPLLAGGWLAGASVRGGRAALSCICICAATCLPDFVDCAHEPPPRARAACMRGAGAGGEASAAGGAGDTLGVRTRGDSRAGGVGWGVLVQNNTLYIYLLRYAAHGARSAAAHAQGLCLRRVRCRQRPPRRRVLLALAPRAAAAIGVRPLLDATAAPADRALQVRRALAEVLCGALLCAKRLPLFHLRARHTRSGGGSVAEGRPACAHTQRRQGRAGPNAHRGASEHVSHAHAQAEQPRLSQPDSRTRTHASKPQSRVRHESSRAPSPSRT